MEALIHFILSVGVNIVTYFVYKWLDGHSKGR